MNDGNLRKMPSHASATRDGSSLKCEGLSSRVRIPPIRCGETQLSIFAENWQ